MPQIGGLMRGITREIRDTIYEVSPVETDF